MAVLFVGVLIAISTAYPMLTGANERPREIVETLVLLVAPFAPHIAEELWSTRHDGLLAAADWPKADPDAIDLAAEQERRLHFDTLADVQEVLDMIDIDDPQSITLFVPASWKYEFVAALKKLLPHADNPGEVMGKLMDSDLKRHGQQISKLVPQFFKDRSKMPAYLLSKQHESEALMGVAKHLAREHDCKVHVELEEHQDHPKAKGAMPGKPAILIE